MRSSGWILRTLTLGAVDTTAGTLAILGKGRTQSRTKQGRLCQNGSRQGEPNPGRCSYRWTLGAKKRTRLTGRGLYHVIREIGKKAGIKTAVHSIRHTAITTCLDLLSGDLRKAERFSRHKNIQTLLIYDDNRADLRGDVARMLAGLCG